jgi:C-terminal processing protease CtpA/Prc
VRRNGGGSPHTVAMLSSYLFDQPTHLNSLYWRERDRTDEFWTTREVRGKRFGQGKPVYVLTSRQTFSGAEEFSYNLKALKRATLVGETTGGGAHPGGVRRVHELFTVFVPTGRAINPVTRTNWEGTGVVPDVAVPADEALHRARELAAKAVARAS